jgi:hypothetical protein
MGRPYSLKQTTLHAIDGIPQKFQILHMEQEVVDDYMSMFYCVLSYDLEPIRLLDEEALLGQQV